MPISSWLATLTKKGAGGFFLFPRGLEEAFKVETATFFPASPVSSAYDQEYEE